METTRDVPTTRRRARAGRRKDGRPLTPATPFRARFVALFDAHFDRLFRVLDRASGDPELASDLAQEAFMRLYRRGSLPDAPEAWLVTVGLNLLRNARSTERRRRGLLTPWRGRGAHADPPPSPAAAVETNGRCRRVRDALDRLDERERNLLVLRAEGYAYRDLARALDLNEASVGTLLARARRAFRDAWEETDAPG